MSQAPSLTDRAALIRNRQRARSQAMFLQSLVADEVQDRLLMVNKSFSAPAIVTPFPEIWAEFADGPRVQDTNVLDLTPGAHDLVIHALCLHWADDPVGQLVQARHALKPDGFLLAALFGGQTLTELRDVLTRAEAEVTGGLSPRVAPMGDIRDLGALLQRAGFALPVADSVPLTVEYDTALHLMRDLRAMGETNALAERLRHPTARAVLMRAAEIYQTDHAGTDGRIRATFEIVFLSGWAPDESQPKPLRPGSATSRLADALDTAETPLKD